MIKLKDLAEYHKKVFILLLLSIPLICVLLLCVFLVLYKKNPIQSILTSSNNTDWNINKATILAKRIYPDPSISDIQKLSGVKNANEAVDIIFTSPSDSDVNLYKSNLSNFIQTKSTYKTDQAYQNAYYTFQLIHDPNRVQRKLYYMFENIFSVDASEKDDGITYKDVQNLDDILYKNSLGNYLQMVEDVRNNYAMAQYLNLTDSNKYNPNENFARELMQLFLMGPNKVTDKNVQNYSDADVNALAYILTGYTANKKDHTIYFDNNNHYSGNKTFLGTDTNDPVHIIDYIVKQKRQEIAEFLSNKLLHFYLSDAPSSDDIQSFATNIIQNNFEILPSLKYLFASDLFYKQDYFTANKYKSPTDLVSTLYSFIFNRNNYDASITDNILSDLDYIPYMPGSIFGRDGFNDSSLFYSGSVIDKWIGDSNKLLSDKNIIKNINVSISAYKSPSTDTFLNNVENSLYLNTTLSADINTYLNKYLTTDANNKTIIFDISNPSYVSSKITGVLALIFSQPELLTISSTSTAVKGQSMETANNISQKLLIVRLKGGMDYQGLVANTNDSQYSQNRKNQTLNSTNSYDLGNGYRLNNAATSLIPLITSKQVSFISAVGLPNHSRAHDVASKQMETGLDPMQKGIIANLETNVQGINPISFSNTPPIMLKGNTSLEIGSSNLTLYPYNVSQKNTDIIQRENVLKNILNTRSYPQELSNYYLQSITLDNLAVSDIQNGGKGTPGSKNDTQLAFLTNLINKNIGNTYYMYADNSYDMHVQEDINFNKDINSLFNNLTSFYNNISKKQKITIVLFSEFGRTDKINGNNGTDHGTGGGMIILSNSVKLPTMIGNLSPSKDTNNWSNVVVDERDVWSEIFNQLYNLPTNKIFGRNTNLISYPITIK